jgi:hypothetical protein
VRDAHIAATEPSTSIPTTGWGPRAAVALGYIAAVLERG